MFRSAVGLLVLCAPLAACSPDKSENDVAAVWAAVEARNATWKENDFEGHMAIYHPGFRRWTLSSPSLMDKETFSALWDPIKANERVVSIDVLPEELIFYADGKVAIAHYTIDEQYQWLNDEPRMRGGVEMKQGDILRGKLRFSDVFIKEGDRWLYAGGHRDGMMLEED